MVKLGEDRGRGEKTGGILIRNTHYAIRTTEHPMSIQVIMPQLGESVVEGTVGKWLVAEGQRVREYEPLLQVTTDKVDTEIPAPASGVLLKIYVPEGQTVPKGTLLAEIGEVLGIGVSGITDQQLPDTQYPIPDIGFISPVVARLAGELNVDLSQVIGTGEGGRITKKDVLAYVAAPVPREPLGGFAADRPPSRAGELPAWEQPVTGSLFEPADEGGEATQAAPVSSGPLPSGDFEMVPLSSLRGSIARHMVLSVQTSPHVTTVMEADMTRVVGARERLRGEFERQGVKLTFTPFFIQAVVAGLKAVPEANSSLRGDALLLHKRVHIGVAVALADGLIVPVISDADGKSLLGLARAVNDLAERGRTKQLEPDEVQGGTFTLTNHGTAGSLFATPIIHQPQAGILGVGAIQKRAVVVSRGHPLLPDPEDAIAIRPMVYLSFTFDHRILDGRGADGFLMTVKRFLEGYGG